MIKDNHLAAAKVESASDLFEFLKKIREKNQNILIELEIDHLEYLNPAIDAEIDVILLDNFSPCDVQEAVSNSQGQILTEVSGGIDLENLEEFAKTKNNKNFLILLSIFFQILSLTFLMFLFKQIINLDKK